MIALINVRPTVPIAGTELLTDLPAPPAFRWSAFFVHISGTLTLDAAVAWALEIRDARPFVPIGVADSFRDDERKLLAALAKARVGLRFTSILHLPPLAEHELVEAVEGLRDESVERGILQIWLTRWQPAAQSVEHLLSQIIAHGVRGGKAKSLRVVNEDGSTVSPSNLVRQLKRAGLSGPGALLRDARLTGAALREQRQVSATDAALAAGYASQRHRLRAKKRRS